MVYAMVTDSVKKWEGMADDSESDQSDSECPQLTPGDTDEIFLGHENSIHSLCSHNFRVYAKCAGTTARSGACRTPAASSHSARGCSS
jgi:hypothetical protein